MNKNDDKSSAAQGKVNALVRLLLFASTLFAGICFANMNLGNVLAVDSKAHSSTTKHGLEKTYRIKTKLGVFYTDEAITIRDAVVTTDGTNLTVRLDKTVKLVEPYD